VKWGWRRETRDEIDTRYEIRISMKTKSLPGRCFGYGNPCATPPVSRAPARAREPTDCLPREPRARHATTLYKMKNLKAKRKTKTCGGGMVSNKTVCPWLIPSQRLRVLPGFACIILGPRSGNETEVVGQKSFSAKLCCVGGKVRFSRAEPQHGKLPRLCIATMKPCL
jgi:hypothetical protein